MADLHTLRPEDAAATFCATLVDEWIRLGVRHAVIAPGSRSTPLALALAARPELRIEMFHDERAASFAALGIGLATAQPAVLLCSSGTAATHFHGAVVEANLSAVPLIVCTADRPPELRDVGAAQTIDQLKLYGAAVRWFGDVGVPDGLTRHTWRSTAAHAHSAATGGHPGPVHLNLSFREPLVADAAELPPVASGPMPRSVRGMSSVSDADIGALASVLSGRRGVIVAGRGCGDASPVCALAAALGWPVLADARSTLRRRSVAARGGAVVVNAFDGLVRVPWFASAHRPEVVLHLGEPPASKVLGQWLSTSGATEIVVSANPAWRDPDARFAAQVMGGVSDAVSRLSMVVSECPAADWVASWARAEAAAQAAIDAAVADGEVLRQRASPSSASDGGAAAPVPSGEGGSAAAIDGPCEPAIARVIAASAPDGASVVVASSMPIRDVEWFGGSTGEIDVYCNRGANGIDGVVSTAIGVAAGTGRPAVVLIGDVALLHDSSALVALARRDAEVRIVVLDNDGGGIFSFLPQASALPGERFEQLFGTPHGTDIVALARAHGLEARHVTSMADVAAAITAPGTRLVVVRSNRAANVAHHAALNAAIAAALE